jgi:hypothetical protein
MVGGYSSVTALTFGARDSADEQARGIEEIDATATSG